jgi:hypothetical protein
MLEPSKSKNKKKLSKVVQKSCPMLDNCPTQNGTKNKQDGNSFDTNRVLDDLNSTEKKILTFVQKNSNLSNQEIANQLNIPKQTASYNILRLIEKEFLVKKKDKIFLSVVQKSLSGRDSSSQIKDFSEYMHLDKWSYTIPVKSHSKYFLNDITWAHINYDLNNIDKYTIHDDYEPTTDFKKIYQIQANYVYFSLYFHVNSKTNKVSSVTVEFNKYFFKDIPSEKAIETTKMILRNYLTNFSQSHNIFFNFNKMKHSHGHIKVCNAPETFDNITFQSAFISKDKSPPDRINELEVSGKTEEEKIKNANIIMNLPTILDETNNSMGALEVQFKGVNQKVDIILSQVLKQTDNDGKIIQILGNLTSRIKEIGALFEANDKEQQLHHEILKKKLKDDMEMYH